MLNTLFTLFSYRKQQLYLQEKHDKKLNENYKKCPLIIYSLFLMERKINREQTLDFKNNNILEFYQKTKKQLEKATKYQEDLDNILQDEENICNNLKLFINKYSEKII